MSGFSGALQEFTAGGQGERRLGPYQCEAILDQAGTAPVFRAVEAHAGHRIREVAIKVFDIGPTAGGPVRTSAPRWQARVVDEARSLCLVQHPNVVRFYALATDSKRGLMGLVMELVDGISADRELEAIPLEDTPRRVALAVDIGIAIASALAAVHAAGIVHCNVKPSNIMLAEGTHKLINFGIAASLGDATDADKGKRRTIKTDGVTIGAKASTLVAKGDGAMAIPGTVGNVDPLCVATTAPPAPESDLYSLGATLYECIAGRVPCAGPSGAVDAKILVGDAPAPPLAEVTAGVPTELAKLVDALLSPTRDGRPRSADVVARSLERIRSGLLGRERAMPPEERGPFPGLDRYEAADRDVFFGRAAEIAGVIELCRTRGLVGVVGLSGSGKSSLLRAGVVPAIEEGALGGWPARYRSVLVTPGSDLMAALDAGLETVLGSSLGDAHPEEIAQRLSDDVDASGTGIVILVDQLEELVIRHDAKNDAARQKAIDLLCRLAEAHTGIRVIVAVRRDLLDGVLAVDRHLARVLSRGTQLLGPLSSAAWEAILDEALAAYDYKFEDKALRRDVLDALKARESAMTLAQFGLSRMWALRDTKAKKLTRAGLDAKDGMRRALDAHAEAALSGLDPSAEKVRAVLLAMTTPEGTRAHVELESIVERFGAEAKPIVFALTKARLVVSEREGFTFVHDTVLREWERLRRWIEDMRDDRLLVAHVERDAARWSSSRDVSELWRKGRLAAAMEVRKAETIPLSSAAREFLSHSAAAERNAQLARWSVAAVIVTVLVGGSLLYAKQSRDAAEQARNDATALSAALAEVKRLETLTMENAMEASASAKLLEDLQKQMAAERATYGAKVQATLNRVATATSLDGAQKATEDLKATPTSQSPLVPLPIDVSSLRASATKGDPGGTGPAGPSAGGGTFDQAAIERVVNTRKAGVKRTCLERSASTGGSTKVTTQITIAPNGTVQSVSSTGDDPVVARCIEQQVRTWSFPPPGEVKQVQIPFVFVRQ